ncbi:MAG: hypothetical protein ABEJ08_04565 [Halobacteriaceae archaeon]
MSHRRRGLDRYLPDRRRNALASWALLGGVAAVAVGELTVGALGWAWFAATTLVFGLVPPVARRRLTVMLQWEVLALAALPVAGRTLATNLFTSSLFTYLSVAALALMLAVELDAFTGVRMNEWFAVFFVVVTTAAVAGGWALLRWTADHLLGTALLAPPGTPEPVVERAVMWEFVASTVAGVFAGFVHEGYVRRVVARGVRPLDVFWGWVR